MPKDNPFVYGGTGYWKATRALRTIRDELGMGEHVTLYATRHSYGTWLAEAGVPVHQIKRLMGHSSIQVTQRYMHASPEQGQRYVDAAFA
jgi:integrase